MGTLVTFCSSTCSVLILAAAIGFPKFVAPNFSDLAIKTRRTSGDWLSQVNTLYLKGARQRTEAVIEKMAGADATNWAVMQRCDEKLAVNLNDGDKIYASSGLEG